MEQGKLEKFYSKKSVHIVAMYLTILAPFIYYLTTDAHFFLGKTFSTAFSAIYYTLMILSALYAAFFALSDVYGLKLPKACAGVFFGVFVFTCIAWLFNVGYAIGFGASWMGYVFYLKRALPYLIAILSTISAVYFISLFKSGRATIIVAVCTVIVIFVWIAIGQLKILPFKLDPTATVLDTGKDYSIVFAASDKSIGWVEYSYGGEDYKIYHVQEGRKVSDTLIHHVNVPYEHLQNNTYTVHVQRVLSNRAYNPRLGKERSESISFKGVVGNEFDALILSDTHNISKAVRNKINYGEPDVLFMLGDFIDELHSEEDLSKYLLGLCYRAVGGSVPVVFSRGNHDLHSEMGIHASTYLGLDQTYYQTHYGKYDFTVLDSGAGSSDDDIQLGTLGDYERQRKEQLDWMSTLAAPTDRNQLLVTHVWFFTEDADNFAKFKAESERMNIKGILAGHSHECAFYPDGFQEKDEDYLRLPTLIAGGVINLIFREVQYTKAHFTDDEVRLTGYKTTQKEALFEETIYCK